MFSLLELVEKANKGESVDAQTLSLYHDSPNSAEKFLSHYAHASLGLREAHTHLLKSLEAIDWADQKVLNQFLGLCDFLNLPDERIEPTIRFAVAAIARREYSLGLEAIQNALASDNQTGNAYAANRENCLFIAEQYERVAQNVGWPAPSQLDWNNRHTRLAYIVSSINDGAEVSRTLTNLAKYIDTRRFQLFIYSTEAQVFREKEQFSQPTYAPDSAKAGAQTIEQLIRQNAQIWLAPRNGDALTSAAALAEQLVKDQIDVAIFDATQADPVAAVVAGWNVAKFKINLCRQTPLYASSIANVIYLENDRLEADKDFWAGRNADYKLIREGGDIEEPTGPTPQRSALGIPQTAVVLATTGNDLDQTLNHGFIDTVAKILQANPLAIYLLIGEGDLSWQKRFFEAAGVAKRVGYAGARKNIPGFLRLCDIYLAEFPAAGNEGVVQAMSVEKPIVAIRSSQSDNSAEETEFTENITQYIQRVTNLIRDPQSRRQIGKRMRRCAEQQFSFRQTAAQIEQLCDQLTGTVRLCLNPRRAAIKGARYCASTRAASAPCGGLREFVHADDRRGSASSCY